ncbi:MAG: hypothetical protein V4503_04390, partial [Gemmatimonadota bacterium]
MRQRPQLDGVEVRDAIAQQANDLVKKGYLPKKYAELAVKPVITKEQAVGRISSDDIERLFYPVI